MAILTFERIETKYLMGEETYQKLRTALEPYMQVDEYGLHTICNIYYDTPDFDLIRTSLDKPVYKEKLRLRSYGVPKKPDSPVFVEIKKKYDSVVYKRRIQLQKKEADAYLNHGILPEKDSQILHEITYFQNHYHTAPKLFLAYDRIAMFGREDHDFRLTFDQNIRSREDHLDLAAGDQGTLLFGDRKMYLLEVKINGAMPLWLAHILSDLEIKPVSFSKYGSIYTCRQRSGSLSMTPSPVVSTASRKELTEDTEEDLPDPALYILNRYYA